MRIALVGLQDVAHAAGGAALRVKQLVHVARRDHEARYWNVGTVEWKRLGFIERAAYTLRFLVVWHDTYASLHYSRQRARRLCEDLQAYRPDVVVLSEVWAYRYFDAIRAAVPSARLIVDVHNADSLLMQQMARKHRGPRRWVGLLRAWILGRHECRIACQADDVWACSQVDVHALSGKLLRRNLSLYRRPRLIPNAIAPAPPQAPCREDTIGYLGIYNYAPNHDAAIELITEIQPRLDAHLYLVGKNPSAAMKRLQGPNVTVTGYVADPKSWFPRIRTMVLPIRTGGGTRFKALEAMAAGVPIVATAKAMEGLDALPGHHYLEAETPDEIAAAVKRLWSDPLFEEYIRTTARSFVQERYGWDSIRLPLDCLEVLA